MSTKPKDVRHARQFLRKRIRAGVKDISPRRFAAAAKEMRVDYSELLGLIARLQSQGQNAGVYRRELILKSVSRGK